MQSAPWTDLGRIQSDIQSLQSEVRGKANSYEIYSLRSDVDRLEHTNRLLSSEINELRRRCEQLQESLERMEGQR